MAAIEAFAKGPYIWDVNFPTSCGCSIRSPGQVLAKAWKRGLVGIVYCRSRASPQLLAPATAKHTPLVCGSRSRAFITVVVFEVVHSFTMRSWIAWFTVALTLFGESHATRASTPAISKSTRCGESFQLTCKGSGFGSCCSRYGYCGSTKDHCESGCQPGFGTCSSSSTAYVPAAPVKKLSTDGTCGGSNGRTCLNSAFGNCCR